MGKVGDVWRHQAAWGCGGFAGGAKEGWRVGREQGTPIRQLFLRGDSGAGLPQVPSTRQT